MTALNAGSERAFRITLRLSAAIALTGVAAAASAQTQKVTVDVIGSAGFSSSPFLAGDGSTSSALLSLSILPRYSLIDERGEIIVDANYRRSQYLRRFGSTDNYGISASASRRLTERLDGGVYLAFDSSILGEQGRQTILESPDPVPDGVSAPLPPPPFTGPEFVQSEPIVDIGLIGLRQRQSQLTAGGGLSYAPSELDQVSAQLSVARLSYSGGVPLADYRTFGASLAYSRSISSLTQVGARLSGQRSSYGSGLANSSIYQPQLTANSRFSPLWNASAAVGLLIIRSDEKTGSGNSTGLSGNVGAVRTGERTNLSLRAYRDASASGFGGVSRVVGASIDHSLRLNQTDSISWSASYAKSRQQDLLSRGRSFSYASLGASYERRLSDRFNAGVSGGYRDTFDSLGGRPADITAQLFIRARLGDPR